jgi:hypothetical protein
MRLLRALAHFVLALALIGVAVGPAWAGVITPSAEKTHLHATIDHHHHAVDHESAANHDPGTPANKHPSRKRDGCLTACCLIPSEQPPRAPGATAVEFFCAIRYSDITQPASGRADAPEPGIPKSL